ncbi:MAG: flavocytochrome c [Sutterellaceae bacterium]|nr:flavocytochrome c [Sutterellaceae bacterium]
MTKQTLSRRNLLKAAGAGAAMFGAATVAHARDAQGVKWTDTYEVVVVGAGGAGMAAAVKAAQNGAKKIIVLEKMPFTGGNTLIAQGFLNAADPVRQPRQNIKDSPEHHMKQTLAAGDYRGDPERVRVLCENAYGAVTWLESLGMKFKDNVIQIFGALYPRSHVPALPKGQGYGTVLAAAAEKYGIEVVTDSSVTEIIREKPFEGDVLGVQVQTEDGTRFIRATRAVVLAAGGFGANQYLRELHDPRVKGLGTDNLAGSRGEVMMAAVRVGAYTVGMDFIQSTPGAPAGKKMKLLLNFNVNGSIYVDKRGNRIVNEGERRDVIRDAVLGTPERYAYTVCDNENFMSYDVVNRNAIMKGIEIGEAWTAPTIRELAEKMGVDPAGIEKTINRYNNEFVKNRKDPDFNKTAVNLTKKIEVGPFWACYTGMTVHHTMGGLNTNTKAQCLDWTGAVIPRLYAAGEITGGIHGTNRVGGNAVLDCFVFGQIAGENAAKEKIRK